MTNGRKRTASFLATLCIASMGGTILVAGPTFAEPERAEVEEKVETLYEQAEQASERYNDARIELKQARTRLSALRKDLTRQQTRLEEVRSEVARSVVDQYQGQALSTATQVMLAKDPGSFIDQLATLDGYQAQQGELMAAFAVQAEQLEMREAAAQRELARIAKTEKQLKAAIMRARNTGDINKGYATKLKADSGAVVVDGTGRSRAGREDEISPCHLRDAARTAVAAEPGRLEACYLSLHVGRERVHARATCLWQ